MSTEIAEDIRRAREEDAEQLIKLNSEFNNVTVPQASVRESIKNNSSEVVFVAQLEGELVGFVCAQIQYSFCYVGQQAEITEIYVATDSRRRGIAERLMMAAEESTAFPMVTAPTYIGGLGFGFKWNMGWMNDILSYIKLDPVYRRYHHNKVTFSLFYAFSENYILPFSHDEVVHGKHSMLDKNPGDLWQKFAGLRALYGYTMAHPGKKLLFMGSEFAHFIEWKYEDQLDWFLLVYDRHPQLQCCVKMLNHFYRNTPAFYEVDNSWDGFQWIIPNDTDNSVMAFLRTDKQGKAILCIVNFTPVFHPIYRVGLPAGGKLNELFNTDREEFGGSNQYNAFELDAQPGEYNGFPFWADVCIPPLSCVYFRYDKVIPKEQKDTRVGRLSRADRHQSEKPGTDEE